MLNKKQNVSVSMMGTDGNLSVIGSFQIIQDAITELMGLHKIDAFSVKKNFNAFWVFTKTRVKFLKKLPCGDEYYVTSFFSNISIAKMNIDVEIKNKKGEVAIYSKTELCILDINEQKIKKLSGVGVTESLLEDKAPMEITFTKFNADDLPKIDNVQIKSTNIDFSHHTNNLEYVRLVMNTYSVTEIEKKQIKEMEIIYSSQSFENDILDIKKANFESKDLIVFEKHAKPVIKCEIIF